MFSRGPVSTPLEDDPGLLRHALWLLSDQDYKSALKGLSRKRGFIRNTPDEEPTPDYTRTGPTTIKAPPEPLEVDKKALESLARDLSKVLRVSPEIHQAGVSITVSRLRFRHLDSEGNRADSGFRLVRLTMAASALTDDGREVVDGLDHTGTVPTDLPGRDALMAEAKALGQRVAKLRTAPYVEDYDGPVLFEGVAAGQAMRAFLASNLSGTPAPRTSRQYQGAQRAFARKRNRPVMPKGWTVFDDPFPQRVERHPAAGPLQSRSRRGRAQEGPAHQRRAPGSDVDVPLPSKDQPESNGHGRGPMMQAASGHPGNLIVQAGRGKTAAALRRELLRLANEEGYDHAYIVRRMADDVYSAAGVRTTAAVTNPTQEGFPQPVHIVRIDKNGTETLVRGAAFQHIIARNLREIAATSKDPVIYNYLSSGTAFGQSFFFSGSQPRAVGADVDRRTRLHPALRRHHPQQGRSAAAPGSAVPPRRKVAAGVFDSLR